MALPYRVYPRSASGLCIQCLLQIIQISQGFILVVQHLIDHRITNRLLVHLTNLLESS